MAVEMRQPNVARMLRTFTAKQLVEWEAFLELEPFALDRELRADYRAAHLVQMTVNMNRDSKAHPEPFPLKDFLLKFVEQQDQEEKPPIKQTWQQQKQVAYAIAMAYSVPALEQ